jgi:hypothetical protein
MWRGNIHKRISYFINFSILNSLTLSKLRPSLLLLPFLSQTLSVSRWPCLLHDQEWLTRSHPSFPLLQLTLAWGWRWDFGGRISTGFQCFSVDLGPVPAEEISKRKSKVRLVAAWSWGSWWSSVARRAWTQIVVSWAWPIWWVGCGSWTASQMMVRRLAFRRMRAWRSRRIRWAFGRLVWTRRCLPGRMLSGTD